MWVVQTPSPWAMVARRWTCVPTRREMTWVSASHSCGNSAATCATGQWCWHSCPPERDRRRAGSVALGGQRLGERLGPGEGVVAGLGHAPTCSAPRARRPAPRRTPPPPCRRGAGDPPQRRRGEVVIGVRQRLARRGGQREHPGGPAPAARARARALPALDQPLGEHRVEVPPDRRPGSARGRAPARPPWPTPAAAAAP